MITNVKNTVWGFKHLLGKQFSDPAVQEEIKRLPYKVVEQPGDRIGIQVRSGDKVGRHDKEIGGQIG